MVKNPPAMEETRVRALGWDNLLEEEMATHSNILAWKNSMDRGVWLAIVHEVTKSQTRLSTHTPLKALTLVVNVQRLRFTTFQSRRFPSYRILIIEESPSHTLVYFVYIPDSHRDAKLILKSYVFFPHSLLLWFLPYSLSLFALSILHALITKMPSEGEFHYMM